MFRKVICLLFFWLMLFCLSASLYAGGLSTTFGEVKVEGLKIGGDYSMEKTAKFPLVVQNTSDRELELKIEVLYPKETELKSGYQIIPDKSWISLKEDYFKLSPGQEAKTDVLIKIPDDQNLLGKKYQVYLWSHTIGRSLGIGLKSRLLFSIAE